MTRTIRRLIALILTFALLVSQSGFQVLADNAVVTSQDDNTVVDTINGGNILQAYANSGNDKTGGEDDEGLGDEASGEGMAEKAVTEEAAEASTEEAVEAAAEASTEEAAEAAAEASAEEATEAATEAFTEEEIEAVTEEETEEEAEDETSGDGSYFSVSFVVLDTDENSAETETLILKSEREEGESIGVLPEAPFRSGRRFTGWYNSETGERVTEDTVPASDIKAVAAFTEIRIYDVNLQYYYLAPSSGQKVVFYTSIVQVEPEDLPLEIDSPSHYEVGTSEDAGSPTYYPKEPYVTITGDDLENARAGGNGNPVIYREVQYVPYSATYYYVHLLKDLEGDGYTEVDRDEIHGVTGSYVMPSTKQITGGEFERTQSAMIEEDGQELYVYYTRANCSLDYVVNGGSYIDAANVPYGSPIDISEKLPVRTGYTFEGWYLDEALTQAAPSIITMLGDRVIYAKWSAQKVNYTVVYLTENADDDGYSFLTSVTKQALVGSEVTETAAESRPSTLDKTNFTFKDSTTKTVKADGSTVVTVRYSRNEYTVTWNGLYYYANSKGKLTYTNTNKSASLKAKYGASITQEWIRIFNTPYPDYAWNFTTNNNDKFVSIDTMPSGNKTVYAFYFATTKVQNLCYWLENYDGEASVARNGKTYGLYKSINVKFNYLYDNADFYDIIGYTKDGYDASYSRNGKTYSYKLTEGTPNELLTANFYYAAQSYALAFYNQDGSLISSQQVKLGTDIASYMEASKPEAPVEGAEWLGWFTDSEHTAPYAGNNRMPTGLALYASWKLPEKSITFMDGDKQIELDSYAFGEKAAEYTPEGKAGYVFRGWYTDKDGISLYDFNKPLTEDVTVYAVWKQKTLNYTVRYLDRDTLEQLQADRIVTSPLFRLNEEITEEALTISGKLPLTREETITLSLDDNVITFLYTDKTPSITYTVRYVLENDPDVEVAPQKEVTVSGDTIYVKEAAAKVDSSMLPEKLRDKEYYPVHDVLSCTLVAGVNEIVFTYTDYRTAKLQIDDVDMDGNRIESSRTVTITGKVGTSEHIDTSLNGYVFDHVEDDAGNHYDSSLYLLRTPGSHQLKVYFRKKLLLSAANLYKVYDGTPLKSEGTDETVLRAEGLAPSHAVSAIQYEGSITDVGSTATVPSNAVISGPRSEQYYDITYGAGSLTVGKANVAIRITGDRVDCVYDGLEHTAGYTVNSISNPAFREEYIVFNGNSSLISQTHVGRQELILSGMFSVVSSQMGNFNASFILSDGYVNITPATVTVYSDSAQKAYDGTPLTAGGCRIVGMVNGESVELHTIGSQTEVGESYNDVDFDWDNTSALQSDYTFIWRNGVLKVTGNDTEIVLTAGSSTKVYDGEELICDTVTASGLPEGFTLTAHALGSQTDAGTGTNQVGDYKIYDASGKDMTGSFTNVRKVNGNLTVLPRPVTVTVTGNHQSNDYDGEMHTVSGYTLAADSDLYTPENSIAFEGGQAADSTASRTDAGTTYMGLTADQFSNTDGNFTVTFAVTDGFQTVYPVSAVVTVRGHTGTVAYDGREHTAAGYDVVFSSELYKDADFTFTGEALASRTETGITQMNLSAGQFTNHNPNFDTVDFEIIDGYMQITPVDEVVVTIKGNISTADYDGLEHSVSGYDMVSSHYLYTDKDFSFTGEAEASGTEAGKHPMGLSPEQFKNNNENFAKVTFAVQDGYQEILPITAVVTVTGEQGTYTYDGSERAVSGYDVQISNPLYTEDDFTFSGEAAVSGTNAGEYPMGLSAGQFANTNENFKEVVFEVSDGKLTINPLAVTVSVAVNSADLVYTGEEQSVGGYTITSDNELFNPAGIVFDGDDTIAGTDAGTYQAGYTAENFTNTDTNYTVIFNIIPGTLRIAPLPVTVTITGSSNTAVYDGEGHAVAGYTAAADSRLYDPSEEGGNVSFSGTAEASGTDAGDTAMGLLAGQFKNLNKNFTVTFEVEDGFQRILPASVKVTVKGRTDTITYDGDEHTVSGYDTVFSNDLYTEEDVTFSGEALASRTETGTTLMNLSEEQFANTNTNFEDVTFEVDDGYQQIAPVDEVVVTITGHTSSVDYDGEEHAVSGYDVQISDPLYTEKDFTFSGEAEASGTDAGRTQMGLSEEQFSNNNENFEKVTFVVRDGYQEILPVKAVVTIIGEEGNYTYDGTEKRVGGYTAEISTKLYTEEDFTFTGTAEVNGTNAGEYPMGLSAGQFANTNENFREVVFEVSDGKLTINPLAVTVSVAVNSADLVYTGKEQSVGGYTITSDNELFNPAGIVFDGDDTITGTDAGTYQAGYTAENFTNTDTNYTVIFNIIPGTLRITPLPVTVTITGNTDTRGFDGEEHTVSGYSVTSSNELYTEEDFTFTGTAEIAGKGVGVYPMGLTVEQFVNINKNYEVIFVVKDGYQDITAETVRTENAEKNYNLTVRYLYEDGSEAAASFTGTYTDGSGYYVVSPSIEGYTADLSIAAGNMTGDTQIEVHYSRNTYSLTIHYLYLSSEQAESSVVVNVPYGQPYSVATPEREGYLATVNRVEGIMPARDAQVTVMYIEQVRRQTEDTEGQPADADLDGSPEGEPKDADIDGRPVGNADTGNSELVLIGANGEEITLIVDYDIPLGLGNISVHAGVAIE